MQTAYITHPQCQLHDMGHYHPECPERLRAIEDQLIASGLLGFLSRHEAPPALREHLVRVHDPVYVDEIAAVSPSSGTVHLDPDTAMNPHSYRAALHAAGAAVEGVWTATGRRSTPPLTRFLAEQLSTAHWFDQRRTRAALGWRPEVDLVEGFRRLAAWYSQRPGGRATPR